MAERAKYSWKKCHVRRLAVLGNLAVPESRPTWQDGQPIKVIDMLA